MSSAPDLWCLYELMQRSRRFEEAVAQLWQAGWISGEMHSGSGEEAILAGVVSQLSPQDAMAVDHRGSAAFLMRGVDPFSLLNEMLGKPEGLCGGQGGHMHLFSKEFLAASSGIVGAGGPAAVGFALAAQILRPGSVAVAFFGEGAMNQGMLMEALHLASAWHLPVLFVCKDDGWAITTRPEAQSGSHFSERVRGLGVAYQAVDGLEAGQVWQTAHQALAQLRAGGGPVFLHAHCIHLEGHFLGLLLLRMVRDPLRVVPEILVSLLRSFFRHKGATWRQRLAGMQAVNTTLLATLRDPRRQPSNDPLVRLREALSEDEPRLERIDRQVDQEMGALVARLQGGVA